MQHFAHEEGRVRLAGTDTKYDYFVKDHLGNTRMTLTEARDSTVYEATMETALASFEESVFLNVAATRNSEEAFEGTQSAKLGPESIGPAKMLVVSPGDTVSMEVYAKFSSSFSSTDSGDDVVIGAALASVFGAIGSGTTVTEQNTYNLLNSEAGTFLASARYPGSSNVPKAYLNYILFDQDFNVVLSQSGYKKVPGTSSGAFDKLEINDKIMEQGGYLYVYLSNEGRTTDGGNVYFDALRVNHKKGAIIQEDHYYPFGLSINALSSRAPLSKPNKYNTFQGQERTEDFDLGWYQFKWRNHDPTIARFFNVDPLADKYLYNSPYAFSENQVTAHMELEGLEKWYAADGRILYGPLSNEVLDEAGVIRATQSVLSHAAYTGIRSSQVRSQYQKDVSRLDTKARTAAKMSARQKTPAVTRSIIESKRPSSVEKLKTSGTANKSNSGVNKTAGNFGKIGKIAGGASVAFSAYNVANAENKSEAVAKEMGALSGAILGGEVFASAASPSGHPYVVGGAAIVGSILGGILGEKGVEEVIEVFGPQEPRKSNLGSFYLIPPKTDEKGDPLKNL